MGSPARGRGQKHGGREEDREAGGGRVQELSFGGDMRMGLWLGVGSRTSQEVEEKGLRTLTASFGLPCFKTTPGRRRRQDDAMASTGHEPCQPCQRVSSLDGRVGLIGCSSTARSERIYRVVEAVMDDLLFVEQAVDLRHRDAT